MLSYRHAFHAGNHADVLKHAILIHCIQYMLKKEKPFQYVDTHAGAGLYELTTGFADRIREYEKGVARILEVEDPLPEILNSYVSMVQSFNPTTKLEFYPGSPLIAQRLLRSFDQMRFHELHKADYEILHSHTVSDPRVLSQQKEGLKGMIKSFPPPSRRGIVLIDPPYENKLEYEVIGEAVSEALQKFASAMILIWYPMLESGLFEYLKEDLQQVTGERWLNVEMLVREKGKGLFGSGLWIVNPPWDLPGAIESMKSMLIERLGETNSAKLTLSFQIP